MARAFFNENVSVLKYGTYTGMLTDIGKGALTGECDEVDSTALMDQWQDGAVTRKRYVFRGELAANTEGWNWFSQLGGRGELVFTWSGGSVSGMFECVHTQMLQEDALKWKVILKSRGEVTVA